MFCAVALALLLALLPLLGLPLVPAFMTEIGIVKPAALDSVQPLFVRNATAMVVAAALFVGLVQIDALRWPHAQALLAYGALYLLTQDTLLGAGFTPELEGFPEEIRRDFAEQFAKNLQAIRITGFIAAAAFLGLAGYQTYLRFQSAPRA